MTARVLVIGAYGNFGSHITRKLAQNSAIQVIAAGRSEEKCRALAAQYSNAPNPVQYHVCDIHQDFAAALAAVKPHIVIHTSGPFQGQDYAVAKACIAQGCHYIDLADSRDFVAGIGALDAQAKARGVAVISGASSVPALTAAVVDHHLPQFGTLAEIDYGITTAQRTNTGLATTQAVLSYAGKPFTTRIDGEEATVYGWQGLTAHKYPHLGWKLLGNCDIPDLALFTQRYPALRTIRFRAGLEIALIHFSLWALTWLVRWGLISSLAPLSAILLRLSRIFDRLGSDRSAFHMTLRGTGHDGAAKKMQFHLLAQSGHGPFIPSTPAILCAQRLARGELQFTGAMPCIGLITLQDYLHALDEFDIRAIQ